VVLGRGKIPADVLFVGEAPGGSENVIGRPFIGPAGSLLDDLIYNAEIDSFKVRKFFTNLLACIPLVDGGKVNKPPAESVKACADRLNEIVSITKPDAIVMVGRDAQKWCPKIIDYDFPSSADIVHPAYILRMSIVQRPLAEQQTTVILRDLFNQLPPF
jgi:DNA polymerase